MKRFHFCLTLVAAFLVLALSPTASHAAGYDMKLGTFTGNWCGFTAEFTVTSINSAGDFKGTIYLPRTGQVDNMTIHQYEDNSLRIIRHLSGDRTGTNQWVDTHPPETKKSNGVRYANFPVKRAGGYGAKVLGYLRMPY
jgi:hypothetical protein